MKRQHKINHGWERPSEPISDRYQRELDEALRKAAKAHRKARQDVERAERRASKQPSPETIAARDKARLLVLQRLDELRHVEELMRTPANAPTAVVHRAGRQDRLEVGVYSKPKTKDSRHSQAPSKRRNP